MFPTGLFDPTVIIFSIVQPMDIQINVDHVECVMTGEGEAASRVGAWLSREACSDCVYFLIHVCRIGFHYSLQDDAELFVLCEVFIGGV